MVDDKLGRRAFFLLLLALAPTTAMGQEAKATKPALPQTGKDEAIVVATVENLKITKADVLNLLRQYPPIAPDREAEAYQAIVDALLNRALLQFFLDREKVAVTDAQIDQEIDKFRQQLKESERSLNDALSDMGLTLAEFRQQMTLGVRWNKYVQSKTNDQALRDYFQKNIDLFTGAQVKASHILIKIDPDASEDAKVQAKQKLVDLKKQISDKKMTFAEAANKYSEDDGNRETPDGGNLDYFTKRGQYIDAFCDAAFALNVGEISDPVETEYGYHLILVTDRKKGQELTYDTEGVKPAIQERYGPELQQQSIDSVRKTAKIEIKPMTEGFFPATPKPNITPVPAAGAGATKGATPPAQP
jgi:parvulin-like peptidyl-prolyl isomerase